ncbi:hypothetical protein ACA910_011891 [Epithemia clementina (nom. ined.)]
MLRRKMITKMSLRLLWMSVVWSIWYSGSGGKSAQRPLLVADAGATKTPALAPAEDDFWKDSFVLTTLAGKRRFSPFLKRFLLSKQDVKTLLTVVRSKVHVEDIVFMAAVGWLLVPILKLIYNLLVGRLIVRHPSREPSSSRSSRSVVRSAKSAFYKNTKASAPSFKSTSMYLVSDHIQQLTKIALLVYLVDVFRILAVSLGFNMWQMQNFPHAFAQLAYAIWFAQRLAVGKKYLLRSYVSSHPETYGRIRVTDRLLNAAIIAATGLLVINILKIQMGVALHSFLAVGSVGTLALGLASQGIATQVLNGLMLASSDRIYEGDFVRFGNGLSGTITQMGWMETIIRGSDEVMVSVPHTDLVKQQVSNLSRVRYSQVYQVLKFKLSDAEKIPDVVASIKDEIYNECPALITDGSRPFRVYWNEIGPDSLDVVVDAHFRLKILSDEYYDNRERVLMAIRRAVRQNGLYFAKEPKDDSSPPPKAISKK